MTAEGHYQPIIAVERTYSKVIAAWVVRIA